MRGANFHCDRAKKNGWTAIASRGDRIAHPRCGKRIEQVQRELREIYVLAKD
jgi:hypothetical protein